MLRGLFALRSINRSRLVAPQLLRIYLRRPHALSSLHSAMPPKAAAAKRGKRKVESTSPEPKEEAQEPATEAAEEVENDEDDKPKKAKRAKKVKEPVKPLDPSVPTNLAVPDDLAPFPRPAEGSLRISAWNVAGLRASEKKGALSLLPRMSSPRVGLPRPDGLISAATMARRQVSLAMSKRRMRISSSSPKQRRSKWIYLASMTATRRV